MEQMAALDYAEDSLETRAAREELRPQAAASLFRVKVFVAGTENGDLIRSEVPTTDEYGNQTPPPAPPTPAPPP